MLYRKGIGPDEHGRPVDLSMSILVIHIWSQLSRAFD